MLPSSRMQLVALLFLGTSGAGANNLHRHPHQLTYLLAHVGLNTHTFVGYRTFTHYGSIPRTSSPNASKYNTAIQNNLLSVIGGADFPDFGECIGVFLGLQCQHYYNTC